VTCQLKGWNNEARRNCLLLADGSVNMYHGNGYACDNRETVGNGVYAVSARAITRTNGISQLVEGVEDKL
jgi:hypothetical protein